MTIAMRPHEEVAGFCARDGQKWPCAAAILAPPEQQVAVDRRGHCTNCPPCLRSHDGHGHEHNKE